MSALRYAIESTDHRARMVEYEDGRWASAADHDAALERIKALEHLIRDVYACEHSTRGCSWSEPEWSAICDRICELGLDRPAQEART